MSNTLYTVTPRSKKIGWLLIIGPFLGSFLALVLWAVAMFVIAAQTPSASLSLVADMINIALGFFSIVCLFGTVIGIPMGIIFLNKKELVPGAKYDERSGQGAESVVPDEIKGWNWGAAGLTWIWGLSHGVWISLLAWVPFVGIIMMIALGLKGNEWAWRARRWNSVESFKYAQRNWMPFGLVFFCISIFGLISTIAELIK